MTTANDGQQCTQPVRKVGVACLGKNRPPAISVCSTVENSPCICVALSKVDDLVARQAVWWKAGGALVVYTAAKFGSP